MPSSLIVFASTRIRSGNVSRGKPHIFVVDDEPMISVTLAAILNQSGYLSESFTNPLKALSLAAEKRPDLLISDVTMPELTGIQLAIQFKAILPECRVLLFSGQASTFDMLDKARELGHDFTVLTKPIHPTELLAAISVETQSASSKWAAWQL